jgi:hypothetical protein
MAEKEISNKEKIKKLEDEKNNLIKKIGASKKQIPADQATASAYGSQASDPVSGSEASERKKQFTAKKNAEIQSVKINNDRIKAIDIEISNLSKDDIERQSDLGENKIYKKQNIMAKLTKKDILSMVESSEPARMTKSELIETISRRLVNEDMEDSVRRSFESGENDYSEILGRELTDRLARESFEEIASKIREKTGRQRVTLQDVQELLGDSVINTAKKEYEMGIQNLERKAVELIRKKYNIPVDAVDFEATITGIPPQMLGLPDNASPREIEMISRQQGFKIGKINREGLKMSKANTRPPQGKSTDELKKAVKRRRLTNAMMQGAARKSQNLHMMDDEFREQNPELVRGYSNLMAANDASYFLMSNETIKSQGEQGIHAGNSRIQLSSTGGKPKVIAQGMTFPILLHELGKGVMELTSLWGLSKDPEVRKYVADMVDNLESETNDIRLGPKIWEKFVEQMPVDNQEVISLTWHKLQELSDDEFNKIIEGLISNKNEAQNKVKELAQESLIELRQEEADDVLDSYSDDDDTETPEAPEGPEAPEEEDELLARLLGKKGKQTEEEPVDDPSTWSKRDLENARDEALDNEDYKMVAYYQSILDRKY